MVPAEAEVPGRAMILTPSDDRTSTLFPGCKRFPNCFCRCCEMDHFVTWCTWGRHSLRCLSVLRRQPGGAGCYVFLWGEKKKKQGRKEKNRNILHMERSHFPVLLHPSWSWIAPLGVCLRRNLLSCAVWKQLLHLQHPVKDCSFDKHSFFFPHAKINRSKDGISKKKRNHFPLDKLKDDKAKDKVWCVFLNPREIFGMHIMELLHGLPNIGSD